MGLFSRTKKSSGAPTSSVPITKPIKVDSRTQLGLKNHPTGFYKNAPKNASGMPVASRMYWNVSSAQYTINLFSFISTILDLNYDTHSSMLISVSNF